MFKGYLWELGQRPYLFLGEAKFLTTHLPFPRCWLQEHCPVNILHANHCLRVCFTRNSMWDTLLPIKFIRENFKDSSKIVEMVHDILWITNPVLYSGMGKFKERRRRMGAFIHSMSPWASRELPFEKLKESGNPNSKMFGNALSKHMEKSSTLLITK